MFHTRLGTALRCMLQLLLVTALVGGSFASDDFEDDDPPPVAANVYTLTDRQLEQWIFGGGAVGLGGLERLSQQLEVRIDALSEACGLSAGQQAKLRLAGSGDVKRFRDGIDQIKRKYS